MTRIVGTSASDNLVGTPGADTILGLAGNDVLTGLQGNDVLNGGTGMDIANYADSPGGITARLDLGRVNDGYGDVDRLHHVEGVTGSKHADTLVGNPGDNVLTAGAGSDNLTAGRGDDTLIAGPGHDILAGGSGSDTFVFNDIPVHPHEILDFNSAGKNHDLLDFNGLLHGYSPYYSQVKDFIHVTSSGHDALVSIDTDGKAGPESFRPVVRLDNLAGLTIHDLEHTNSIQFSPADHIPLNDLRHGLVKLIASGDLFMVRTPQGQPLGFEFQTTLGEQSRSIAEDGQSHQAQGQSADPTAGDPPSDEAALGKAAFGAAVGIGLSVFVDVVTDGIGALATDVIQAAGQAVGTYLANKAWNSPPSFGDPFVADLWFFTKVMVGNNNEEGKIISILKGHIDHVEHLSNGTSLDFIDPVFAHRFLDHRLVSQDQQVVNRIFGTDLFLVEHDNKFAFGAVAYNDPTITHRHIQKTDSLHLNLSQIPGAEPGAHVTIQGTQAFGSQLDVHLLSPQLQRVLNNHLAGPGEVRHTAHHPVGHSDGINPDDSRGHVTFDHEAVGNSTSDHFIA